MTEKLAEQIILSILEYRNQGIEDEEIIISKLEIDYHDSNIDFDWFLEMMNAGAARAMVTISLGSYPNSNVTNDIVNKVAFKIYWIEQKGEEDYHKRFPPSSKKWWQVFK